MSNVYKTLAIIIESELCCTQTDYAQESEHWIPSDRGEASCWLRIGKTHFGFQTEQEKKLNKKALIKYPRQNFTEPIVDFLLSFIAIIFVVAF